MSLEQALADNTAALKALTAAMGSKPAGGSASTSTASTGTASASQNTRAAMNAALEAVRNKLGTPAAKEIVKDVGGVAKMADIPDDKIDAVYAAATKKMTAEDEGM